MIVFSWRQFRTQALVGFGALALLAIIVLATGPHLMSAYNSLQAACKAEGGRGPACNASVAQMDGQIQVALAALVLVVPALIGMFWGAPLVARELETGTFRLAWTQSVSRRRWLTVKLGLVGLASAAVAGLLSLMSAWWMRPIDALNQNRFSPGNFGLHGFVPVGYAVFAFALGAGTGLVIRRTLPAIFTTLVAFIAARLVTTYGIRPHLVAPKVLDLSLAHQQQQQGLGISLTPVGATVVAGPPNLPNAWVYSANVVNNAGQSPGTAFLKQACPNLPGISGPPPGGALGSGHATRAVPGQAQQAFQSCMDTIAAKFHEVVTYQPASRFWEFQAIETAIFVGAALAIAGACFWWLRHRIG